MLYLISGLGINTTAVVVVGLVVLSKLRTPLCYRDVIIISSSFFFNFIIYYYYY